MNVREQIHHHAGNGIASEDWMPQRLPSIFNQKYTIGQTNSTDSKAGEKKGKPEEGRATKKVEVDYQPIKETDK